MAGLRHGYTNETRRRAASVEKTYVGSHRFERARTELACLACLGDRLAVPPVIDVRLDVPRLTVGVLAGDHGQDLIDRGRAELVLRLAGAGLAALARIPASTVTGLVGNGPHLVHGDFGPQNLLVDPAAGRITGILDWEFAHWGDPMDDLAWICVRDWRFGQIDRPVGGLCDRARFYAAYEQASGRSVAPRDVRFWELLGNVRWAIGALCQGERYLSGAEADLELVAIARRANEMEYEALRIIEAAEREG